MAVFMPIKRPLHVQVCLLSFEHDDTSMVGLCLIAFINSLNREAYNISDIIAAHW